MNFYVSDKVSTIPTQANKTQTVFKNQTTKQHRSSKAMASLTIRCGPSHKSRRPRPSTNSLSAYMPTAPAHRQVTRVKRTVPSNNKFAALAVDTNNKSRRGDRFNGPRPSTAMVAQGSWSKKLTVSLSQAKPEGWAPVSNSRRVAVKPQPPKAEKQGRPCAYCKDDGCHIKRCDKLAEKNRRRAEWKRKYKARKTEEKKKAAEARLVEMFRIAQQQKQQAVVVEDYSDSSDESSSEEEDYPALPTVAKAETRRVTFKGDSENLMKPPCKTKVFDKEQPASSISDDDEEEVILLEAAQDILKPSANAWRPKRLRTSPERQLIIDQIKEKEAELASFSSDSWADSAEIEQLEDEIEELKAKLA